ncbi:MAG: glycosyltransferase family 39 protein [Chloroflexi bacterium]|nr:glycosyltransferase family 39 protein [Chloroflexota bacterium]
MAVYAAMLWMFAHIQVSVLDEGLYLYKGWLFASGRYAPFQQFGPWTNQMPLSFLIPGWMEMLFGLGMRTGRMLAFALSLLMILGLWLTSRRLGGRWVALGVIVTLTLNPAAARMYTMAASQGLVACLLAWTMFFSLGADRKNWQLFVGGLLAGVAVMVRINLLPLLPLLAMYVFWENWGRGYKSAFWMLGGMLISFGGVHLVYWPNILQLWAKWLPFPFLKDWFPPKTIPTWKPDNPFEFRVASFFLAFRYHFAALTGAFTSWILWPKAWKSRSQFRIASFLSVLLAIFFILHAWAALGNEYCVFCFPTYTSFYGGVGLLLLAVTVSAWNFNPPRWRKWLGGLSFLALLAGMAYSAEGTAEILLGEFFYKHLLATPFPFWKGAQIWQVVANKFQLEYKVIFDAVHAWFPVALAVGFGLLTFAAARILMSRKTGASVAVSARDEALGVGLVALTVIGILFSATPLLAGEYNSYDCPTDVIPGYEAAGAELRQVIPSGATVYWAGYSPVTLLALPDVTIYPSQLHGTYSFRIADDDQALLKYGWWNQYLAEKWLYEADFVLVEQRNLKSNDWLEEKLLNFERVLVTGAQSCQPDSTLLVYRRK